MGSAIRTTQGLGAGQAEAYPSDAARVETPRERNEAARRLVMTLAQMPGVLAAAQADPAEFINRFCFGKDFERGIEFKAQLWPWQERFVRHLAGVEAYDQDTPFRVASSQLPVASSQQPVASSW